MKKSNVLLSSICLVGLISCRNELQIPVIQNENVPSFYVSVDIARNELQNILNDVNSEGTRNIKSNIPKICQEFVLSHTLSTRSTTSDTIPIYVFNFEDNRGFAIMSGDDRMPSLIALSESGNLDINDEITLEGGSSVFFEHLNNTLGDFIPQEPIGGDIHYEEYDTYGPWENIVYNNSATCKVKWGQGSPYNRKVVELHDGRKVLTGCVATAVAQLMSVHQYPPTYDGHIFNWEVMTSVPKAYQCSTGIQDQIAMVMAQLGLHKHLDTTYGTYEEGGSPAKTENIPRTLTSLGYNCGGTISDYDTTLLINELKNGYPVLVSGSQFRDRITFAGIKFNYNYSGGHQWLAHGLLERKREVFHHNKSGQIVSKSYEYSYYPRYNWGWDDYCDGYFLSSVFDSKNISFDDNTRTEGEDYNFQYIPKIITGIRK